MPHGEIPVFLFSSFLPSYRTQQRGKEGVLHPRQIVCQRQRRLPRQSSSAPGSTAHFLWARNQVSRLFSRSPYPFPDSVALSFSFFLAFLSLGLKADRHNASRIIRECCIVTDITCWVFFFTFFFKNTYFFFFLTYWRFFFKCCNQRKPGNRWFKG